MRETVRALTPLVLLGLCLLVWFEPLVPGADALGENVVLRLVVGLLCLFLLVQIVERQQLKSTFEQILARLQQAQHVVKSAGEPGGDQVAHEAMSILVAALDSDDPKVRGSAARNLERLSGRSYGEDAARWRQFLNERAGPATDSQSGLGGPGGSP